LDALGPAPRAELLQVLMLPNFDRADRIGSYWANPKTRTFAELLIDCEEDWVLRAVLVGMLRADEDYPGSWSHREATAARRTSDEAPRARFSTGGFKDLGAARSLTYWEGKP
jgi:hypothetical protein